MPYVKKLRSKGAWTE